jgi:hypothetical protein
MRVLVMVKASGESEAGDAPSEEMFAAMGKYNEELVNAGIMRAAEGLLPSSKGKKVLFDGERRSVVDGPFTEAKELVAGYWIWEVKSMDEAVEWLKRCPNPTGMAGEVEIRPIAGLEDLGEAFTPDLRAQDERIRAQMEGQQR